MAWNLFIDDGRWMDDVTWAPAQVTDKYSQEAWVICRNKDQVLKMIYMLGMPSFISFDHDLGDDEPTGYDIVKTLVDLDMGVQCLDEHGADYSFPEDFDYYVHSKNPVGKTNIESYLVGYFKAKQRADEVPPSDVMFEQLYQAMLDDEKEQSIIVGK